MDHQAISEIAGVFGVLFFPAVFLFVLSRLLRKGAREEYRAHGRIPFNED